MLVEHTGKGHQRTVPVALGAGIGNMVQLLVTQVVGARGVEGKQGGELVVTGYLQCPGQGEFLQSEFHGGEAEMFKVSKPSLVVLEILSL